MEYVDEDELCKKHYELLLDLMNGTNNTMVIKSHIENSIQKYQHDEVNMKCFVSTICKILITNDVLKCTNILEPLVHILPNCKDKALVTFITICLQQIKSEHIWHAMWPFEATRKRHNNSLQVLVECFEYFLRFKYEMILANIKKIHEALEMLLISEIRHERFAGYYLMRKIITTVDNNYVTKLKWPNLEYFQRSWSAYISILENLEENQSHLILPSLNALKFFDKHNGGDWQKTWLPILYKKLLQNTNILVKRWTIKYFMDNYNYKELSGEVLFNFFSAANYTNLYNFEDSDNIDDTRSDRFLKSPNMKLLSTIALVDWRSVPLHYWLFNLNKHCNLTIELDLLLQLAARVRQLQNSKIRHHVITQFLLLFKQTIDDLKLSAYISLIESLYNVTDEFTDTHRLGVILKSTPNIESEVIGMTKRFYDIIIASDKLWKEVGYVQYNFENYMSNIEAFSWLRFVFMFDNVDRRLERNSSLEQTQDYMMKLYKCTTPVELALLRTKCIDFYMEYQIQTWDDLLSERIDPLAILNTGTVKTFVCVCSLLRTSEYVVDETILNALIGNLRFFLRQSKSLESAATYLLEYSEARLPTNDYQAVANKILNIDLNNDVLARVVLKVAQLSHEQLINGLLHYEPLIGEARIEAAYMFHNILMRCGKSAGEHCRQAYFSHSNVQEINASLFDLILQRNNELTLQKVRYFENSQMHRMKLRLIYALFNFKESSKVKYWNEELWTALYAQNNQLNISYLYELFIAKCVPNLKYLMDKLEVVKKFTTGQQMSYLSVVYTYCMLNWKYISKVEIMHVIEIILPFTMGPNFQTRTFVQLIIYNLIENYIDKGVLFSPLTKTLQSAIVETLGDKMEIYEKDLRFLLHQLPILRAADIILYATNAPYDEYNSVNSFLSGNLKQNVEEIRAKFIDKSLKAVPLFHDENQNVLTIQKKMSPNIELFLENCNLYKGFANKKNIGKSELYVIASLIDKLPNLGGIARTCEVFGIVNLVLHSKHDITKSDFTNLSMTAEKNLNIIEVKCENLKEYLVDKKLSGHKIIGAEQTANSCNFTEFQFPKKCVLILGHEKHGIPLNLLGLLDYAVEIPQAGNVRSLNVHVTGALFMWEYCKQHVLKKD